MAKAWQSDHWPKAVDPRLIVEEDSLQILLWAEKIASYLNFWVNSKDVLNYGGHHRLSIALSNKASTVVGYHPHAYDTHDFTLCTDPRAISKSDYDIIILYDVIDTINTDLTLFLRWISSHLRDDGKIIIRAHPWTSAHGANQYLTINKAYVHLLASDEELGIDSSHNLKILDHIHYNRAFISAGLSIQRCQLHFKSVHKFFDCKVVTEMIKFTWGGNINYEEARKIMSYQYIDYVLTK